MGSGAGTAPVVSVVVPTRNEAGNVETLVSRVAGALSGIAAEIVFVDDSTDDTPAVLETLAATRAGESPALVVVHRPAAQQTGLGSAVVEGLRVARGGAIAVIDADLQHPPELLREMLQAADERELDVVVASRFTPGGSAAGLAGPARQLVSSASRRLAQLLFREARKTTDPLSGYFLCRRAAIEGLVFRPIGFKILLEVLVCAPRARVGDLPLRFDKRHSGESNASAAQGWAFFRHLLSLLIQVPGSARPWKYAFVGAVGLVLFLAALAGGRFVGLSPFQSWAVGFGLSLGANWQLNRVFTFADVGSPFTPGRSRPGYLPVAVLGGCLNLVVFAALLSRAGLILAGLAGAAAASVVNYGINRRLLNRPAGAMVAVPSSVELPIQGRVAALVDGIVVLLPDDADEDALARAFPHASPPLELLRAADERRPMLLAKAQSHVAQPRHDVPVSAWLSTPVMEGRRYLGLIVVHREGRAYTEADLDAVLRSLRSRPRQSVPLLSAPASVTDR